MVVLVLVSLVEVIYIIKIICGLDDLEEHRIQLTEELTSKYVMGLKGEALQQLDRPEETRQAFQAGKKRRQELVDAHGAEGFDAWLADHEMKVVEEARKQFRILISDALWAGWASERMFAKDQWLGWGRLYGRMTDPYSLKKMDLFLKYATGSYRQVDGYLTGQWTQHKVDNKFEDMD